MITLKNILDVAEPALKLAALKGYSVDNEINFSINHRLTRCLGRFLVKPIYVNGDEKEVYIIEVTSLYYDVCPEFIDTVLHEVAHFIAYTNFDDMSHSKQWKQIAIDLGADPYATAFVDSTKIAAPKKRQKMRAQCVCSRTVYRVNSITKLQVQKKMIKCPACKIRKLYLTMSDI